MRGISQVAERLSCTLVHSEAFVPTSGKEKKERRRRKKNSDNT